MRVPARFAVVALLLILGAIPATAQGPAGTGLDVTAYEVVYQVPAMREVVERRGLVYARDGAGTPLHADVALPPGKADGGWPAVVFVNGVGGKLNEWAIYRTWARLVAAHGMAGVLAEASASARERDLESLFAFLGREAAALAIDPERLAVWACSGNVSVALPFLAEKRPAGVRAAVIYYGSAELPRLTGELPLYYVLAGRDNPQLNARIRALWRRAVDERLPWTIVQAPALMHAFDALDEGAESLRVVGDTVRYLTDHLKAAAPPPAPSPARLALQRSFAQEWADASAVLREIAAARPGDADVQVSLGNALSRAGKPDEAVAVLRTALAAGAGEIGTRQALSRALLAAGRAEEALAELERVLAALPPSPWLVNEHAMTLLRARRFNDAIARFAAARELGFPAATAEYNIACAHALAGRRDDGLAALERAVALGFSDRGTMAADDDLTSLRDDPRFVALTGQPGVAAAPPAAATGAAAGGPRSDAGALVESACRLADAHLMRGRPAEGVAELDRLAPLLASREPDGVATARLALARGTLEHYRASLAGESQELAVAMLSEALSGAEAIGDERLVADAADRLGLAVYSQGFHGGSHTAALPHLERALAIRRRLGDGRGVAETLFHIGLVHENRTGATAEGVERALALYREALPIAREGGFAIEQSYLERHVAGIAQERGDLAEARAGFERSLELRRQAGYEIYVPPALLALADVLAALGEREAAAERYREALERARAMNATRFVVNAHLALGDLARSGGDSAAARASYRSGREAARAARYAAGAKQADARLAALR